MYTCMHAPGTSVRAGRGAPYVCTRACMHLAQACELAVVLLTYVHVHACTWHKRASWPWCSLRMYTCMHAPGTSVRAGRGAPYVCTHACMHLAQACELAVALLTYVHMHA